MAQQSMFDNFVGPFGVSGVFGFTGQMAVGHVAGNTGPAVGMKWWRPAAGAQYLPQNLSFWKATGAVELARLTVLNDSGNAGWQYTPFDDPIPLVNGDTYISQRSVHPGFQEARVAMAARPAAPVGASWAEPNAEGVVVGGVGTQCPLNADTDLHGFTVVWDTEAIPGAGDPPVNQDIENALVRWFDSDADNTRNGGLPWLTKLVVDNIAATQIVHTAAIAAVAPAISGAGGATLATVLTNLNNLVGTISGGLSIADYLQSHFGNGADGTGSIETTLANIYQQLLLRAGRENIAVGGTGWTLQDDLIDSGSVQWVQPADAYTLTMLDQVESARLAQAVGIGQWFVWRGVARPFDGTHFYPERCEVVGPDAVIRGGGRWPGIALWLPPDIEWELKAYNYTGA